MIRLSKAQVRRVAIAAQGLDLVRPSAPNLGTLRRTIQRIGVLQVDSVNVLQRAHYLPLFSRIGPYAPDLLDKATGRSPRRAVEYWAHVAAIIPIELWPVFADRMAHYRKNGHPWMDASDQAPHDAEMALTILAERGPSTARDLDDGALRSRGHWGWNWSTAKKTLEYLFLAGEVAVAGRTAKFERIYDLVDRVIPAQVRASDPWPAIEANQELIRRAARAHGIASPRCLADYYRIPISSARPAIDALVRSGELTPVQELDGWRGPLFLHVDARSPRKTDAQALLAPFDPLIWERNRTESVFDFRYRIGIYTPAAQREHGYYVLPFLLGDRLVARVDLKADRKRSTLTVQAAFAEVDAPPNTAAALVEELAVMATWLGLTGIEVAPVGDLAPTIARLLR